MFAKVFAGLVLVLIFCDSIRSQLVFEEVPQCIRTRKQISVDWPGCEPAYTRVPTCQGTCRSYDIVIPRAPYFQKECNCCKSVNHSVKKRRLSFDCDGKTERHTVFIPIINDCNCARCEVF